MTDADRCRSVIAALEQYCVGHYAITNEDMADALDLLRRYGPNGGTTPMPTTCANCRRLMGDKYCRLVAGSQECMKAKERI